MANKPAITPVGGYILVKPLAEEETTASGLILQSNTKEKPQRGTIVSLGSGAKDEDGKLIPFNVEKDQVVLFKKYAPEEIEMEGDTYLIMKESDILAILG